MKKLIAKILVITLILSSIPNLGHAGSLLKESANFDDSTIIDNSLEKEISDSFGEKEIAVEEELNLEVVEDKDEQIIVTSELETDDIQVMVDVHLNSVTEDIEVFGTYIDEAGEITDVNFEVNVIESEGEFFKAIFIDKETGEELLYDSTEINASIPPLIGPVIAFIARWGVQKAIKHFGKKTLREVAKNISKSDSPVWKKFKNYKGKTKTSGTGKKKKYYEWDHTHNDIEVYDHKGVHLGSMDPLTGEMYKGPVKGRKIKL